MSCLPCFGSKKKEAEEEVLVAQPRDIPKSSPPPRPDPIQVKTCRLLQLLVDNAANLSTNPKSKNNDANNDKNNEQNQAEIGENGTRTFTFRELAMATKNFKQECVIGEGGFGKLYKAKLQSGEIVAVKQLYRNGTQGNKEFLVEVLMLTLLRHPNLANLIGYCADGDQRLLVYEYLPMSGLDNHLHDIPDDRSPLDWQTRMKIASGTAQGLEYLHEKANPPIIYRDLKSSNILMDEEFNPRLSDYGLAKLTQGDAKTLTTPRVMGNYGYGAPEYERNGELTLKSDVYSFGVVLLELITGRKALDTSKPTEEQNLVSWAQPFFKEPKRFPDMADPLLKGNFPDTSLNQAVGVAAMCLQDEPSVRPLIGDVVVALSFLATAPPQQKAIPASAPTSTPSNNNDDCHSYQRNEEDDNESISSDSRSSSVSSEDESVDHTRHGSVSVDYRQNSTGEFQDGRSNDSNIGHHTRYDDSLTSSISGSSRYKSQDESTFANSGRQQESMKSRDENIGSQSGDSECNSSRH